MKEADAVKLWDWLNCKRLNQAKQTPKRFAQLASRVVGTKFTTRLHFAKQRGGKYIITVFPQFD